MARIRHLAILTEDVERLVKFYTNSFGLKIVQPSGDPSYDESVLRAVKKSSPLPAPPESYRKDFAEVELTFRPRDLGA